MLTGTWSAYCAVQLITLRIWGTVYSIMYLRYGMQELLMFSRLPQLDSKLYRQVRQPHLVLLFRLEIAAPRSAGCL